MSYSTDRGSLVSAGNLEVLASHARSTPPGAFVEVGVYRGGSARVLYEIAERQGRTLWLFDTFDGHPTPGVEDSTAHPKGRFADCADPQDLALEMPGVRVVIGPFPWSLYHYYPQLGLAAVAFAHIDVDLYDSTREAITGLLSFMVPGGVMYFDDYGVDDCPGATKAVDELCPGRIILPNGKAIWRR